MSPWRAPGNAHLSRTTALLTLLIALPGCFGGEPDVVAGNRAGILYYGIGSELQTLDPHIVSDTAASEVSTTLFEGLVRMNPQTLEPEPGVATHWETSADGLSITFHLNPLARWSNGDAITAGDFVWSWQRSLNPAMANVLAENLYPVKNAEAYSRGIIKDPGALGVVALDALTLRVDLEHPTPYIFPLLDYPTAYPVHRPTIEAFGSATDRYTQWTRMENMVNNGPFRLADWKLYRHLRVERSETYWDADNVSLNGIVFRPIDNVTTEEKMFRAGQLHFTQRVPNSKIPDYVALENSPYEQGPLLGSYYYLFNINRAPVDDVRVRRALAYAIDRDQLVARILLGTERPSASITPVGIPGYTAHRHVEFNPARARELLAAAGYPDGRGWPGLELIFNTDQNHRRVAIALQQMWRDHLNIAVSLENQEWKVFLDTVNDRQFRLARMGWIGSYLDPGAYLNRFTSDGNSNRTGFANARYDEIIKTLVPQARSVDERMALMHEAENLFMAQMPIIPLYSYNGKHLVQPSVSGLWPNILEARNFKHVTLDPAMGAWRATDED